MQAFALAQVEALVARIPNNEYLSKLLFLQPAFHQFDIHETNMTNVYQVNKDVLYADLAL